jgi:hypothetical protein
MDGYRRREVFEPISLSMRVLQFEMNEMIPKYR